MLELKNIKKDYQAGDTIVHALKSVSVNFRKSEFVAILGPSGCGKTTLLNIVGGLDRYTNGDLIINNTSTKEYKDVDWDIYRNNSIGFVFQNYNLISHQNVITNVELALTLSGVSKEERRKRAKEVLIKVGLDDQLYKKPNQLSGGQMQRVAIARCLVLEPAILLLDEPLGSLDLKLRENMKVELKKLQAEVGTTFIYITHDQSEAMVMSDAVAVMNSGHFEQIDTPQNLYVNPKSSFVSQFVGDNNQFIGKMYKDENGKFHVICNENEKYNIRSNFNIPDGEKVEMYIRPEAIIINPNSEKDFNIVKVNVKEILFDGANSRLLVIPEESKKELIVSLHQNRQFDYIKKGDVINIGWDIDVPVCFRESGVKTYDKL